MDVNLYLDDKVVETLDNALEVPGPMMSTDIDFRRSNIVNAVLKAYLKSDSNTREAIIDLAEKEEKKVFSKMFAIL